MLNLTGNRMTAPRRKASASRRALLDVPVTGDEMSRMLQRERARADRTGLVFSTVSFHIVQSDTSGRRRSRLAQAVVRRKRETDEFGWMTPSTLTVVLPSTDRHGAASFAMDICKTVQRYTGGTPFEIHQYPDTGSDDDGPGSNGHSDETEAKAETNGDRRAPASVMMQARDGQMVPIASEKRVQPLLDATMGPPMSWWKRSMDIMGASALLLAASPVLLAAAAAIKLTSPGPIMFCQRRAGLNGREFTIFKLRTMCVDAEARKAELRETSEQDGPAFKMKRDPRITAVGALLRATSIDELPQLLNVLRGEMSLVGPRPLPVDEQAGCDGWQQRRLDVTPGLTCIWQVKGRSRVSFEEWVRMDMAYIRSQSLLTDLKILMMTVPAVLLRRGAC